MSFENACAAVQAAWPDYTIAPYGYEGETDWFVLLLPETVGGRIAAVAKSDGSIRWINENDDQFMQQRRVGVFPQGRS